MTTKMNFKPGSFTLVPNKKHFKFLTHRAVLAWFALCSYADEDGNCWPSKKTMADLVRVGERTMDRGIQELEEKKWIKTRKRKNEDGGYGSNYYTLFLLGD